MKNSFNASGASRGMVGATRIISNTLSAIWGRVSSPILIGQHWGAAKTDTPTQHLVDLRSVMPWNTMPAMFSGRPEPQKSTWVAVSKETAEDMKYPNIYVAIISPIHIRSKAYERSLMLPLLRIW